MRIPGRKIEEFCYTDKYYNEYAAFCYDARVDVNDVEFSDKDLEEIVDQYEEEIIEILRDKGYRISESKSKKITLQNYKKLEDWLK